MQGETARTFAVAAHAKLNLRLEIGPHRGRLHEILSAFAELELHDTISFAPAKDRFSVECAALDIGEHDNLAWRGAKALCNEPPRYRVTIEKRIPTQAGLGGGSSDAAATLLGLRTVLQEQGTPVSWEHVVAAAVQTGSDVPSFLERGLRVVSGTGDRVEAQPPSNPPPWGVLLFRPIVGSVTADAYALLDAHGLTDELTDAAFAAVAAVCEAYRRADFSSFAATLHNDFAAVIEEALPQVEVARRRLEAAGALATTLCGSGSCVAGFFQDRASAQHAHSRLALTSGEWAHVTGFSHA